MSTAPTPDRVTPARDHDTKFFGVFFWRVAIITAFVAFSAWALMTTWNPEAPTRPDRRRDATPLP